MAERRQPRVLGAKRTASDALGTGVMGDEELAAVIKRVVAGTVDDGVTLGQLERALAFYASHNSEYTRPGEDDINVLTSEILNNSIRAVMLFSDFSAAFTDVEVYSISVAMQYNLSLEALTINGVNVSDEAISMLCEALVQSRVSFIDLSNTPLEDEAGRSLAALAHVNPYVRTIVLDDTLIAEEVLDEIDVACQFNQSNFEANAGAVEIAKPAELARLRHRLQHIIRAKHKKTYYCVAHLLGMCPNGDLCLYSHTLMTTGAPDANANLHERLADLFATGGNWQDKLPSPPQAGASWKDPSEGQGQTLRLNLARCKAVGSRGTAKGKGVRHQTDGWRRSYRAVGATVALAAAAALVAALWSARRR
ncbi:uncharacterized protein Tco025E_07077 [Trypanosoma conorhini]|uniref:C3H1-type domain-containing protein n=1 Tax=Trypanosoma conorhini TaxID=83891 RepID=A0A3R7NMT1_9TRYP|nr:uncharacterized protein Tco025E_07077 [Trypanosoma conorhini]RNF08775.1 hypothetical protein Tco025E_07077 [Trypanosoma conorhini]